MNTGRMLTVMRTDLKQLIGARDFWIPMVLLGGFFFFVVPAFLLSIINNLGSNEAVQQVSDAPKLLSQSAQQAVPADVGDRAAAEHAVAAVQARFGRLDLVVNAAGVARHVLFKDHDVGDIEQLVRTNLMGTIYVTKGPSRSSIPSAARCSGSMRTCTGMDWYFLRLAMAISLPMSVPKPGKSRPKVWA